ncbi:Mannose-6-phosphate isomerase [Armadillidium vulgare]|nr:Mannose-6-phosphate isomerase [Armadillidium vulgare]
MAIALTPFQALCGFRPHEEIQNFFREFPELRNVVGENNASAFILNPSEENLKNCFSFLMTAPKDVISSALKDMEEKLSSLGYQSDPFYLRDLFLNLKTHYPGDVGCFSIYLLNYIVLEPGEAIFLGPNVIHAYLHGDCIECMACSDNVVRAGLTPKYQDVDTLLAMLEYRMIAAESRKFKGSKINQFTTLFNPPVPDFAVQKIEADNGADVTLTKEFSASILIVVKGVGLQLNIFPVRSGNVSPNSVKRGSVLFIEAEQIVSFFVDDKFLAFRALCI